MRHRLAGRERRAKLEEAAEGGHGVISPPQPRLAKMLESVLGEETSHLRFPVLRS